MIGKCGLTSRETDDKIKLSEVFANGLPQSLRKAPSDMQSFESFRDDEGAFFGGECSDGETSAETTKRYGNSPRQNRFSGFLRI